MAWFKRNKANDAPFSSVTAAPNLQDLKRKARNRLIGMLVLVLAAIITFAFLLDSQPRPGEREIVYEIPERGEQVSVSVPAKAQAAGTAAKNKRDNAANEQVLNGDETLLDTPAAIRARRKAALAGSVAEGEEMLLDEAPLAAGSDEPAPSAAEEAAARRAQEQAREKARAQARLEADKAAEKTAEKSADKAAAQKKLAQEQAAKKAAAENKNQEAERARALLEGKKPAASTADKTDKADKADNSSTRTVVQFGSFSDPSKAAEVRRKVEAAGLKTYAQEIDTPKGKLTRLRVGPFTKASEAEAAAKKIKALGLPAAILTL